MRITREATVSQPRPSPDSAQLREITLDFSGPAVKIAAHVAVLSPQGVHSSPVLRLTATDLTEEEIASIEEFGGFLLDLVGRLREKELGVTLQPAQPPAPEPGGSP